MKKLPALFCITALMLSFAACSDSGQKESSASDDSSRTSSVSESTASEESAASREESRSEHALSYKIPDAEKPMGKSSTLDSPLGLNEWGSCAKQNLKDYTYTNVPVRIVSIRRGETVFNELKEMVSASRYLFEPRDEEEYLVCEYEICLDGFPVPKGGTLCDISGSITGTDGQFVKLSTGSYWSSSIVNLDEETYYYDGVIHSMFCSPIPREVKDYLVILGTFGETQAYFKPE